MDLFGSRFKFTDALYPCSVRLTDVKLVVSSLALTDRWTFNWHKSNDTKQITGGFISSGIVPRRAENLLAAVSYERRIPCNFVVGNRLAVRRTAMTLSSNSRKMNKRKKYFSHWFSQNDIFSTISLIWNSTSAPLLVSVTWIWRSVSLVCVKGTDWFVRDVF